MEIKDGEIFEVPYIAGEIKLFNDLAKESYAKFLTYDSKSVAASMNAVLRSGGKYWVLWDEDKFAGVCMGMIVPNFYNHDQTIAECIFVGVIPEHQRTRWGLKMMRKFEEWGKEQGADFLCFGGYDKKYIRNMKRNGFEQVDVKLMKRLENG